MYVSNKGKISCQFNIVTDRKWQHSDFSGIATCGRYTLRKKCYKEAEPPYPLSFWHFPVLFDAEWPAQFSIRQIVKFVSRVYSEGLQGPKKKKTPLSNMREIYREFGTQAIHMQDIFPEFQVTAYVHFQDIFAKFCTRIF